MSRRVAHRFSLICAALAASGAFLVACSSDAPGGFHQIETPDALTNLCPTGHGIEACSDEGASRCEPDGTVRVCTELGGCLQWGAPTACGPGTACEAGQCVARGCENAPCTAIDQRRCDPDDAGAYQLCGDANEDGCLEWLTKITCPSGQATSVCAQGGSCGGACADECAAGFTRCEGDQVVTCEDHDHDGCLEWGGGIACPDHCSLGVCVTACADECEAEGLTRCDGNGVAECRRGSEADGGCLGWGPVVGCPVGTSCSNGTCSAACIDECETGETACEAGAARRCGQFDADPCLDWSLPSACEAGSTCSRGACASQCTSECTTEDVLTCDEQAIRRCGQYDDDACLEWGTIGQCDAAAGEVCANGACAVTCVDACDAGAVRCRPGSATVTETCAIEPSGCRGWEQGEDCGVTGGGHAVCADGKCAATCSDDCATLGTNVCLGDGAFAPCGQFDDDPCLDLGTDSACAPATACSNGACAPIPPPSGMKISEILPNSEGQDDDTFIELAGPPGASLEGLELVALNGTDGVAYAHLSLGGTFDGHGYFVIAHPNAVSAIADTADVLSTFADLQNGPDNLVLKWGDTVLDALGYGGFGAQDVFAGEGTAAAQPGAGESLGRIGDLQDTGDNHADFGISTTPTPGHGFIPVMRPNASGQVVFDEVMANPEAVSDSVGEWFEVASTRDDASFDLQGCELRGKGGELHTINNQVVLSPRGLAVFARQPHDGLDANYYYGSAIGLTNDSDQLSLVCDGTVIDTISWAQNLPQGASWNLDPTFLSGTGNDDAAHWCRAPVTSHAGFDEGTPGALNPPCPGGAGAFTETLYGGNTGTCGDAADWHTFTFIGAPIATGGGTLQLDWQGVFCEVLAGTTTLELQLEVAADTASGKTWQSVGTQTIDTHAEACAWTPTTVTLDEAVIAEALSANVGSAAIGGRYRITTNCPSGTGCGLLGSGAPPNCVRNLTVSYPY